MMRQSRSPMSRFVVAMAVYMAGSLAIEFALILANGLFHLHLERRQSLLPAGFPLVGNMSWFSVVYLVALIGLIWLLYRAGVMPRGLFGRPPARTPAEWDTYTMGPRAPRDVARTQDDERIL